ncbi:MAG TPA: TonB family protein [Verrucomicrobiae bacterium]|nr:TonB family protein [Verrucomicrobiae bacterium]
MIEVRAYLEGQIADGRFPLIRYLGGTEHSAVFLTECAESGDRKAAIKLIPAPPGNCEAQLTRWRLAAKFSHPNLLRLFHAGRCDLDNASMLYVVMECADENLAEILGQRPLSSAETREVAAPVLDALGYLHGKGFVHAHIQPSNILAIGDRVMLSTDAICRIGESLERRNGHSRYAAPESATAGLSPAADVWSLGMTIVECLTQRLPAIDPGSREAAAVPADLPAPFFEIARHSLSPAPLRRWNVAELKARLLRNPAAVEDAPIPVRRRAKSKRQFPLAWAALACALAAVLIAFGFFVFGSSSRAPASANVPPPVEQTQALPAKAEIPPPAQPPHSDGDRAAAESPASVPAAPAPAPVRSAAPMPAPARPAPPGDLAGGVVHRVLPGVPRGAQETIWGTVRVRVRVQVDPSGNVVGAQFDSPGPSPYFAGYALQAARQWKFRPQPAAATAPCDWLIRFNFTKDQTTASAVKQSQ